MSIKQKFIWTQVKKDNFNKIKQIMARDTLLIYPDLMKHLKLIPMLVRSN